MFKKVLGDQFGRKLSPLEQANLVTFYGDELLKIDRLTLWSALQSKKKTVY